MENAVKYLVKFCCTSILRKQSSEVPRIFHDGFHAIFHQTLCSCKCPLSWRFSLCSCLSLTIVTLAPTVSEGPIVFWRLVCNAPWVKSNLNRGRCFWLACKAARKSSRNLAASHLVNLPYWGKIYLQQQYFLILYIPLRTLVLHFINFSSGLAVFRDYLILVYIT